MDEIRLNLIEEKTKIIQSIQTIQDMVQEHIRIQENTINQAFHHGIDMKDLVETTRNKEIIIANQKEHLSAKCSEEAIRITTIKMQASEITSKDREIERLNRLLLKTKSQPPPKSSTVIDAILSSVGETIKALEPDFEEETTPQTKIIVSRNTRYLIVHGHNIVYSIQEDNKMGPRVGVWSLTTTGRRRVILDN